MGAFWLVLETLGTRSYTFQMFHSALKKEIAVKELRMLLLVGVPQWP